MPRDPFRRIHDWDDGYEYVQPDRNESRAGAAADYYNASPQTTPPSRSPPARTSRYADYEPSDRAQKHKSSRDGDSYRRSARRPPSPPPSNPDNYSRRPRREAHLDRSPPPAYTAASRATSPPRRRERDTSARYPPQASYGRQRPAAATRYPSYDGSSSSRENRRRDFDPTPPSRRRTFSPSPPPRNRRNYSPSPPPRDRYRSRDRAVPRASSPPRPQLRRSNTTSGAAGGKSAKGFAGLSPAWQKAGLAALQSGAVAAFSSSGPWTTEKGARVASAALAGAFSGRNGDSGRRKSSSGGGGKIGGALGGLLAEQLVKRGKKHF